MREVIVKLKSNLTHKECIAIEELAKRKDLIINKADKGGVVVIMDTDNSIKESDRQLYDKANYKQLTEDPRLQHIRNINLTILSFSRKSCRWSKNKKQKKNSKFTLRQKFINQIILEHQ